MKTWLSRLARSLSLRSSHGRADDLPRAERRPVVRVPERIPVECSRLGRVCCREDEHASNDYRETCQTCAAKQQGSCQGHRLSFVERLLTALSLRKSHDLPWEAPRVVATRRGGVTDRLVAAPGEGSCW